MIELGSRVESTGAGRTKTFKDWLGTVTNVVDHSNGGGKLVRVYTVVFDAVPGTVSVELTDNEIRLRGSYHVGCECAQCEWTRNHPSR